MNFLNPLFLLGLVAILIPVILHLLNLKRPQKVAFSTLSFFNELRKSTIRRIRIKQYLLLALRTLAILFLALALARPFLPPTLIGTGSSTQSDAVAILVDNSASMSRVGVNGPLIERAQEVARQIIDNSGSDTRFLLQTTNIAEGTDVGFLSREQALTKIDEITTVNSGHYTSEQFTSLYTRLQNEAANTVLYLISDGQKSQLSDIAEADIQGREEEDEAISVQLITLGNTDQRNIAVNSLSLESQLLSPGSPITIAVEVQNTGSVPVTNQYISLQLEGEMSGQYEASLQPGEVESFSFEVVPDNIGYLSGQVLLEGDEVSFDNRRYFVVGIPERRSVLLVNESTKTSSFISYIAPALEAAKRTNARVNFDEKRAGELEQNSWTDYDGIVFNGITAIPEYWFQGLRRYVQEGGGILFFPSEQGDIGNYNRFLSLFNAGRFDNVIGEYGAFEGITKVAALEEGHPIIDDIFNKKENEEIRIELPSLFYYYHLATNPGTLSILETTEDNTLLAEHRFGEGVFLTSAFGADPGWSNFPVNPLFAPLYYRAVLYTSSPEQGGFQQHQLGKPFEWTGPLSETGLSLSLNETDYKPLVQRQAEGVKIIYDGREWEPGILTISSPESEVQVAVNQDTMESDFQTLDDEQWSNILGSSHRAADIIAADDLSLSELQARLHTAVFGKEIWNWFIWIALLFLIIETAISRLYKAESTT